MSGIEILIEQVRAVLIETEDAIEKHEIYNRFINECRANNLTEDDFYKNVLKPAHKSVDWNYIEEQKKQKELEKKQKEAQEKEAQEELERIRKDIQQAPRFISHLIKTAFDDNVVERNELIKIFEKADNLSQDTYELAERISTLIEEKRYKAYPKANFDLPSLRATLCSTNWHSEERYQKITTPPPEKKNSKINHRTILVIALVAIAGAGGGFGWYFLKGNNIKNVTVPGNAVKATAINAIERYNKFNGKEYFGKIGGKDIKMKMDWKPDETVAAVYYNLAEPETIHDWQGLNFETGVLKFTEYVGGTKVGEGVLKKTLTQGNIYWSGELYTTDGTNLIVSIYRTK